MENLPKIEKYRSDREEIERIALLREIPAEEKLDRLFVENPDNEEYLYGVFH